MGPVGGGLGSWRPAGWAVILILVSACNPILDYDRVGFEVINRTDVPIDVDYLRAGNRIRVIDDLPPGEGYAVHRFVNRGECRDEGMLATDDSGSVMATFPGPVCDGMTWEVGEG